MYLSEPCGSQCQSSKSDGDIEVTRVQRQNIVEYNQAYQSNQTKNSKNSTCNCQRKKTAREKIFMIEDLGSANGTTVNNSEIRGKGRVPLKNDDVVSLGGVINLKFRG